MSLLGTIKTINSKLGNPARMLGPVREAIEPPLRLMKWERDRKARAKRYDSAHFTFERQDAIVEAVDRNGFAVVPNAILKEMLLAIKREAERHLDHATALSPVSRDSARREGDLSAAVDHLSDGELKKGQDYFRQHTNYVSVHNPLVTCPSVWQVVFNPLLIDIAHSYLDCIPAVGGLNLRKSYVNELGDFDTLYFHIDLNSPKFLKFFFYLNDVDEEGGPFSYVRGSHKKRFPGWRSKGRWTLDEMERAYGKENIVRLTANVGDMLIADTNGFHRGTKVRSNDRFMLTIDYSIHEEFDGTQDPSLFKLPRTVFEQMTPKQRAATDFLLVS